MSGNSISNTFANFLLVLSFFFYVKLEKFWNIFFVVVFFLFCSAVSCYKWIGLFCGCSWYFWHIDWFSVNYEFFPFNYVNNDRGKTGGRIWEKTCWKSLRIAITKDIRFKAADMCKIWKTLIVFVSIVKATLSRTFLLSRHQVTSCKTLNRSRLFISRFSFSKF